jgi:hypothetical protein
VQFDDEPAVVRHCVSGNAPGAKLMARVVNVYGDEAPLPNVTLGKGFLNRGELRYDRFTAKPYEATCTRAPRRILRPPGCWRTRAL